MYPEYFRKIHHFHKCQKCQNVKLGSFFRCDFSSKKCILAEKHRNFVKNVKNSHFWPLKKCPVFHHGSFFRYIMAQKNRAKPYRPNHPFQFVIFQKNRHFYSLKNSIFYEKTVIFTELLFRPKIWPILTVFEKVPFLRGPKCHICPKTSQNPSSSLHHPYLNYENMKYFTNEKTRTDIFDHSFFMFF